MSPSTSLPGPRAFMAPAVLQAGASGRTRTRAVYGRRLLTRARLIRKSRSAFACSTWSSWATDAELDAAVVRARNRLARFGSDTPEATWGETAEPRGRPGGQLPSRPGLDCWCRPPADR